MKYWREIRSALTEVTPAPGSEPSEVFSLTVAKNRLRIDIDADDPDLELLKKAARQRVERDTGFSFVNTEYELTFDGYPCERWLTLPRFPLVTVASVKSFNPADAEATFAAGNYFVDTKSKPGRICLNAGASWPTDLREHNAGVVRFTAGFGTEPELVPEWLALAQLYLVGHWFRHRASFSDKSMQEVPMTYRALISDAPLVLV